MKRWKKAGFLAIWCVLVLGGKTKIYADEYPSEKSGLDVVFVMDYSGSMKSNDSELIAQGMVKAFIDTVHSADIRIGFVAYNDRLLSTTFPVPVKSGEDRQKLKRLIDTAGYSGNTDIGLGLRYAYDLIKQQQSGRKKAIVLISDGESDLEGSQTGRRIQDSMMDVEYVMQQCVELEIPIYSIAFGNFDGSTTDLKSLSEQTKAQMYTVEKPEDIIEILYGIFSDNTDYSIQQISDGIYAPGVQNILLKLDEAYLDELDVLMISPQPIGPVSILYGGQSVDAVNLKNYAVAKITDVNPSIKELTVQTETARNQELQIYLISYRNLTPVLNVNPVVDKNVPLKYEVYFKDKNGSMILDETFYKRFTCTLQLNREEAAQEEAKFLQTDIQNGIISGYVTLNHSGKYNLSGWLDDSMGTAAFAPVTIEVCNHLPSGELPENEFFTVLTKEKRYLLNDYFSDEDGDLLTYSIKEKEGAYADVQIEDGALTVNPVKSGRQTLTICVSDGEETLEYPYELVIVPIWKAYWWVIPLLLAALTAGLWKIIYKPKPELERIAKEKKQNRFFGRLDAYCMTQPEGCEEIPPLSFQMYKIKDSKLTLGDILREYPDLVEQLELDEIYLVADEERRMILYHKSKSSVMIGNSVVCRQIQYSVSFGDVIYITSSDGAYELDIHYIKVIQ